MTLEEHLRLAYRNGQPEPYTPEPTDDDPEPETVTPGPEPVDVPTAVTEDRGNAVVVVIDGVSFQVSGDQLTIV